MNEALTRRSGPSPDPRGAVSGAMARRTMLFAGIATTVAACESMPPWLGGRRGPRPIVAPPQVEKLLAWLRAEGRDTVLDPSAPRIMGFDNGNQDIPVKQLAAEGPDGRYVVSLFRARGREQLIFHRRQRDTLYFHLAAVDLTRAGSASFPRNGAPSRMADSMAPLDFDLQTRFWIDAAARR